MANEQNLIPQAHELTVEEASKGGRKSGEARRRKKLLREAFEELLSDTYVGTNGNTLDGTSVLAMKVFKKAMEGDLKAFELIRDSTGQKPAERIETVEISEDTYNYVRRVLNGEKIS